MKLTLGHFLAFLHIAALLVMTASSVHETPSNKGTPFGWTPFFIMAAITIPVFFYGYNAGKNAD